VSRANSVIREVDVEALAFAGRLGRIATNPGTVLLSANEAKERLREIVKGFFFRRRNDGGKPSARQLTAQMPSIARAGTALP
jgi:hypothetical protein